MDRDFERRDWVEAHRSAGGPVRRIPLVRVEDESYCPDDHMVLYDDGERKLLSEGLRRVRLQNDRRMVLTRREKAVGLAIAGMGAILALVSTTVSLLTLIHVLKT